MLLNFALKQILEDGYGGWPWMVWVSLMWFGLGVLKCEPQVFSRFEALLMLSSYVGQATTFFGG